jgi:hypothetical protein
MPALSLPTKKIKRAISKVEFMKFSSVALPRAAHGLCGLAGLGLVVLAAMPTSAALAGEKDAQPAAAPANPAPAAKPAPAPAAPAPAKPAPTAKPASAALPVECVRTGQRVAAALARDDSGTAGQFHNFYVAFKCPPQRLAQAFGCLVNLQAANPGLTNPSPEQVTQCWDDPVPVPKTPPPPAPVKPSPAPEGGEKK